MKARKWLLAGLLATLSSCACAKENTEELAIRNMLAEFSAKFSQRDANAVSFFWVEDGEFIDHLGRMAKGRAEIASLVQKYIDHMPENDHVSFPVLGIKFVRPNVAVVKMGKQGDGQRRTVVHFTQVLEKRREKWGIVSAILTIFEHRNDKFDPVQAALHGAPKAPTSPMPPPGHYAVSQRTGPSQSTAPVESLPVGNTR